MGASEVICVRILQQWVFLKCKADQFIFHKIVDGIVVMFIYVYVGDLLEGGSQEDCESFLLSLNETFPTNDLGEST